MGHGEEVVFYHAYIAHATKCSTLSLCTTRAVITWVTSDGSIPGRAIFHSHWKASASGGKERIRPEACLQAAQIGEPSLPHCVCQKAQSVPVRMQTSSSPSGVLLHHSWDVTARLAKMSWVAEVSPLLCAPYRQGVFFIRVVREVRLITHANNIPWRMALVCWWTFCPFHTVGYHRVAPW